MSPSHPTSSHEHPPRLARVSAPQLAIHATCLTVAGAAIFAAAHTGSRTADLRAVIAHQNARIHDLTELAARTRSGIDDIEARITRAEEDRDATVASAATHAAGSVYMIGAIGADGRGWQQIGTGWVARNAPGAAPEVGPIECDVLATNAHVVDSILHAEGEGLRVVARMPGLRPVDLPILGARAHPGWKWASALADAPLLQVRADGDIAQRMLVPAADVGIVYVQAGAAAAALPLADPDTLARLEPGSAVGIVGYPSESMAGPRDNHVAQVIAGSVTALTSAFHQSVDPSLVTLIHHNLPMGGGSSGSPILDRFGRVIGVQSAGNVAQGAKGRIPLGTGYAQRVDLLAELLDGVADAHQQKRQIAWGRELRQVSPAPDTLLAALQKTVLTRLTAKAGLDLGTGAQRDAAFAVEQQYTAAPTEDGAAPDHMRSTERTIAVKKGETYAFLAVGGPLSADVDLSVMRGKKVLAQDTAPDPLPVTLWTADEDGLVRLIVSERRLGAADDLADELTVRVLRVGG